MGDVAVADPTTGEIRMVPAEGVESFTQQTGWGVATPEQRQAYKVQIGGGQQAGEVAQAALEKGVRTATLGLAGPMGQQERERQAAFQEQHPYIAMGAQAAGTLAPALVTGGLAGGAAGALGVGARGAGLVAAAGEGLAGGTADEIETARHEMRGVSAGNIFLYGLGGEIVGRALPHALAMGAGKVKRALTAVEAAAGEGVPDALAAAEAHSVTSQAKLARDLPPGSPERAEALRRTAPQQFDRLATETTEDLGAITDQAARMGETNAKRVRERVRDTIADESPAQIEWVTATKRELDGARKATRAPLDEPVTAAAPETPPVREQPPGTTPYPEERAIPNEPAPKATPDARDAPVAARDPAHDNALEYAVDAARRRLRGVADHTGDADLDALVGQVGERSDAIRGIPSEAKRTINDTMGKAKLEDVVAWVKDPEALRAKIGLDAPRVPEPELPGGLHEPVPAAAPDLPAGAAPEPVAAPAPESATRTRRPRTKTIANSAGMKAEAAEFEATIERGLGKLDKASNMADQFLAARDTRAQLEQLAARVAKKGEQAEPLKALIDQAHERLRSGLSDKSLFGQAAEIEGDITGPWREKVSRGLGMAEQDLTRKVERDAATGATEALYDPGKVRKFLQRDALDRKLTQDSVSQVLEGAEELAAAHERHGTWDPAEIAKLREKIGRAREALGMADEIHAAKAAGEAAPKAPKTAAAPGAPVKPESGSGRLMDEAVAFGLQHIVGHAIPFAGQAWKVAKTVLGIDGAAKSATRQAARNLAGVGLGYAERVAGKVAAGAAGGAAAAGTMTALARFTGDYSGPTEAFEARKKILDDEQVSPDVLYETLANGLGDLPKVNPDLFEAIAARTMSKVRYLRDNMPAGIKSSLLYPNGTPPSTSALRDWAVQWNTVMHPETVIDDLNAGTATAFQMQVLNESDPDLYEQLRTDCIEQIGTHFRTVPVSTKLQLDLLFGADGLAGPMFSSAAADMVRAAGEAAKQRGSRSTAPPETGAPGNPGQGSGAPSGLEKIKTSVTNRAA